MAVFSCIRCGYMYEFLVSNSYTRRLTLRRDHCPRCNELSTFRFMSLSGMVGRLPYKPVGVPTPSYATLYWRKKTRGVSAMQPLDEVCGPRMWRELLHKCGVLMHTAVGREWVPAKNCLGLLNVDGADIPSGSLLAAIPMTSCCSPALLRQSAEWGSISSTIPGYSVTRNAINFECSEETLQTAVHVALMAQQRVSSSSHPVSRYIHFILRAERAEDSGLIRNRWRDTTNPAIVEGIGQSVEDLEIVKTKVLENLLGLLNQWVKPPMTLESLHAANYLCESRCVEVVHEKYDVFEGPAFVPFLDLINHATQPNITVQLTPSPFLISHLRRNRSVSSIPASEVDNHVPFYVTVYADRAISPGDELEYPYLEENNPTLWASRFHFIPEPCVGEQQPVANVPE